MVTILSPELTFPTLDTLLARYTRPRRRKRMEPLYKEMLVEAQSLATPRTLHKEFGLTDTGPIQAGFKPETVAAVIGIVTLGPALDERAERLNQSDMAMAVILEEIALALVVNLTKVLHGQLREEYAEKSLKAGPAYRPGIGRWPMELQRTIFQLLPGQKIGVELTEDLYMLPIQSTSLIIPILDKSKADTE